MSSQLKASTVAPPPLQRTAEFLRLRALSFRESPEFFLTVESHFVTRVRTQLSRSRLLKASTVTPLSLQRLRASTVSSRLKASTVTSLLLQRLRASTVSLRLKASTVTSLLLQKSAEFFFFDFVR